VHILPKGLYSANRLATATREESNALKVGDLLDVFDSALSPVSRDFAIYLPLTSTSVYAQSKTDWGDRAGALGRAQDWQGLLAHGGLWTQAEPDNAIAWYNLGLAYGKLGRHREAIGAYREALRLKPDLAEAWFNLASAYANLGNRSAALEALKQLRRYDAQKADKLFNLIMKP
jgi:tetratricopeptide (TPR) repeat protein